MADYEHHSDEELLERYRAGEQEIMDYILNKYKPLVRKRAKDMYLIGGEGEDLIQEGMIGLFKAVQDYRGDRETSFLAFADLCISRQIYTAIRASNRKKHQPLNTYISLYAEGEGYGSEGADKPLIEQLHSLYADSPETVLIDRENVSDLQQKMRENLSGLEQEVLLLYLAGNDYTQIAQLIEKPPKSVDNALHRARAKLAVCLKQH